MDKVKVDKQYFDIEIDENNNIISDYKIKSGVSKKHLVLKLLKNKGFEKLQGFDTKKKDVKEEEKEKEKEKECEVADEVVEESVLGDLVEESIVEKK